LLIFERPFLALADLCAQLGVLFHEVYFFFLKTENFFLKLEKARLDIR
jgi:hypothetical protein